MPSLSILLRSFSYRFRSRLLLDREHHQATALGVLLQEVSVVQGPNTAAAGTVHEGNILLAIGRVGGRVAVHAAADLERPQVFAVEK